MQKRVSSNTWWINILGWDSPVSVVHIIRKLQIPPTTVPDPSRIPSIEHVIRVPILMRTHSRSRSPCETASDAAERRVRFNRRDSSKARNDRLHRRGARGNIGWISTETCGRAQRRRSPSPLEKAARKAATRYYTEEQLAMPPSQMHTSARKASIPTVLEDRRNTRERERET